MRKPTLNGFFRKLGLSPWVTFATKQMKNNLIISEGNDPFVCPMAGTGRTTFIAAKALFEHVTTGKPLFMESLGFGFKQVGPRPKWLSNANRLEDLIRFLAAKTGLPDPVFLKLGKGRNRKNGKEFMKQVRSAIKVRDHE